MTISFYNKSFREQTMLELTGVSKTYNGTQVLQPIDLHGILLDRSRFGKEKYEACAVSPASGATVTKR